MTPVQLHSLLHTSFLLVFCTSIGGRAPQTTVNSTNTDVLNVKKQVKLALTFREIARDIMEGRWKGADGFFLSHMYYSTSSYLSTSHTKVDQLSTIFFTEKNKCGDFIILSYHYYHQPENNFHIFMLAVLRMKKGEEMRKLDHNNQKLLLLVVC